MAWQFQFRMLEQVGGDLFNSTAIFDGYGRRVGTYRKLHIPGQIEPKSMVLRAGTGESDWLLSCLPGGHTRQGAPQFRSLDVRRRLREHKLFSWGRKG